MNLHQVLKTSLIFMGGVLCTLVVLSLYRPDERVLGANTFQEKIEEVVQEKEKEQAEKISDSWFNRILPAITGSPLLAPIFNTHKEVNEATETVRSLPTDQKKAICEQICTP